MMAAAAMISISTVCVTVILVSATLLEIHIWIFTNTILRMNCHSHFCFV